MHGLNYASLLQVAVTSMAGNVLQGYLQPVISTLSVFAGLISVLFIVIGGVLYSTSSGNPEKLDYAKRILKNALVGLVLVIAAATLASLLTHAYHAPASNAFSTVPSLGSVEPQKTGLSITAVIIKAVTGFLNNIIQSIAAPFLKALASFTSATPLVATNTNVFNLWLIIVGLADSLFVLIVAFLGFHIMSASMLGIDELSLKQMLPQLAAVFLLINCSIFLIDGLISFSNVLIRALQAGLGNVSIWNVLTEVVKQAGGFGVAALLIMMGFLVLAVVLLIYYVLRIVTLYIGAVIAPLVLLLWLIPAFKDFAQAALKTYLSNIFVLFVHVIILGLAASLFAGMSNGPTHTPDPLMAMIVGIAALIALLKTQGFMMQLSYASVGTRSMRNLGRQFVSGASYIAGSRPHVYAHSSQVTSKRNTISNVSNKKHMVYKAGYSAVNRKPDSKSMPVVIRSPQRQPATDNISPSLVASPITNAKGKT